MDITYKRNGEKQVMKISGIDEAANLPLDEWWGFYYLICYRFEHLLPTKTITGLDYEELKDYIFNLTNEYAMSCAIVNRVWSMGAEVVKKQKQTKQKEKASVPKTVETEQTEESLPKDDYILIMHKGKTKTVQQLDRRGRIIREFPSATAAGKNYGISPTGIQACCRGIQHTSGGRWWQYKKEA